MLSRHRRRLTMIGGTERRQPRVLMRLLIGLLALFIAWYLVTKVLALFDYSFSRRMPTQLTVRSGGESVQVSLQGGDWQRGEAGLKLYAGDAVALRGGGDAILTFFDGTRIRMERNSDILLKKTDRLEKGDSILSINLRAGRLWITTPATVHLSGAVIRTILTQDLSVTVPKNTHALLANDTVTVLRAEGAGVGVDIGQQHIIVGEGQYLTLSADAKKAIAAGIDPYDFRDPVVSQILRDEFLSTSYALLSQDNAAVSAQSGSMLGIGDNQDIVLQSPIHNAHITTKTIAVSGQISPRVSLVLVNGQSVALKKNGTFSVDMSLSKDATTNLRIEAQDQQGIVLATLDRTVFNDYKPSVEPVRIKSPVGSGQTLTTGQREVEITGEAPANTAAIILNDYKLQLFKAGSRTWSYLASTALGNMVEGKNVYTVYTVDNEGNRSESRSISIVFSLTAPVAASGSTAIEQPLKQNAPLIPGSLSVTGPATRTEATTDLKEVILEGATSADTNSISINGYTLSLYLAGKTTWNYIASTELQTMKRGRNVYRIVSRNKAGEILDVLEYTINYKPQ